MNGSKNPNAGGARGNRPLRVQVRDWVLDLLARSDLQPGDRIPTEQDLVSLLGVSRATLREGLQLLEQEGLIRSRHGSGRYLVQLPRTIALDISRLRSVHRLLEEYEIAHTVRVLEAAERSAGPVETRALGLADGEPVLWIERVHRAGKVPIIYSVDILPASLATSSWSPRDFEGSLLDLIETRWGVLVAHASSTLRAVTLDRELAQRVGVSQATPWMLFEQVNYDAAGRPVIYSTDYHRGEHIHFHVMRFRR